MHVMPVLTVPHPPSLPLTPSASFLQLQGFLVEHYSYVIKIITHNYLLIDSHMPLSSCLSARMSSIILPDFFFTWMMWQRENVEFN